MNANNRVCALLGIDVPIIQAGMVWCSGWELASAVSGAGGLGILGAGSMYPEVLRDQIQKVQAAAPGKPMVRRQRAVALQSRSGGAHGQHCRTRGAHCVHERRKPTNVDGLICNSTASRWCTW